MGKIYGYARVSTEDQSLGLQISALRDAGVPGLTVRSDHTEWFVGQDPPAATLTAEPFTLFRLLFGRRSLAQMAALDWTGSPDLYLDHLSVFDPAVDDIDE